MRRNINFITIGYAKFKAPNKKCRQETNGSTTTNFFVAKSFIFLWRNADLSLKASNSDETQVVTIDFLYISINQLIFPIFLKPRRSAKSWRNPYISPSHRYTPSRWWRFAFHRRRRLNSSSPIHPSQRFRRWQHFSSWSWRFSTPMMLQLPIAMIQTPRTPRSRRFNSRLQRFNSQSWRFKHWWCPNCDASAPVRRRWFILRQRFFHKSYGMYFVSLSLWSFKSFIRLIWIRINTIDLLSM